MSPDAALAGRAADILAELLTATRDPDPATLTDALERVHAELDDSPLLSVTVLTLLTRISALTAEVWCAQDDGDWSATVARMRERMVG